MRIKELKSVRISFEIRVPLRALVGTQSSRLGSVACRATLAANAERFSSVAFSCVVTAVCMFTKDSRCAPVASDK